MFEFIFKKPKCAPCKFKEKIVKAKDGDMIPVPEKCIGCDYYKCNFTVAIK